MASIDPRTLMTLLLGVALGACSASDSPPSPASDDAEMPDVTSGATSEGMPDTVAAPADDAMAFDPGFCAEPGDMPTSDSRFVTFDAPAHEDPFITLFEGSDPGPERAVAVEFYLAPLKFQVPISLALVCSHEQYRVDRCAATLNPRLDGEVLSFTLANQNGSASQDVVIGNEAHTSASIVSTRVSGEVVTTTIERDVAGIETLVEASSLGSGLTIVENPDCSGSFARTGNQPGDSIDFRWTTPKAASVELTYTVCEVGEGCESGTLP